jgi:hypothetical protein
LPSLWWALENSTTDSATTAVATAIRLGERVHFEILWFDQSDGWLPETGDRHVVYDVDDVPGKLLSMSWEPMHHRNKSAVEQLGDLSE